MERRHNIGLGSGESKPEFIQDGRFQRRGQADRNPPRIPCNSSPIAVHRPLRLSILAIVRFPRVGTADPVVAVGIVIDF